MQDITLDLAGVRNVDDFHDLLVSAFKFPDYYGRNRDAFWDCITDIFEKTHVRVVNLGSLSENLRPTIMNYVEILREYEVQRQGAFTVTVNE